MLGPGVLLRPGPGRHHVVAPLAGRVLAVHPHAVVVRGTAGDVLVHLGVGTVALRGAGFTSLVTPGRTVSTGEPMIVWDTGPAESAGHDLTVPVVVLQAETGSVRPVARPGSCVRPGDPLLRVQVGPAG